MQDGEKTLQKLALMFTKTQVGADTIGILLTIIIRIGAIIHGLYTITTTDMATVMDTHTMATDMEDTTVLFIIITETVITDGHTITTIMGTDTELTETQQAEEVITTTDTTQEA